MVSRHCYNCPSSLSIVNIWSIFVLNKPQMTFKYKWGQNSGSCSEGRHCLVNCWQLKKRGLEGIEIFSPYRGASPCTWRTELSSTVPSVNDVLMLTNGTFGWALHWRESGTETFLFLKTKTGRSIDFKNNPVRI